MVPVISVVGNSGVGKTTLLEKLIRLLKERGYRVGAIKHDAHDFQVDYPGKDSWRMTQAGADAVIIANARRAALMEELEQERSLDDLVKMIAGRVDIVLTEGYRGAGARKIEVSRLAHGGPLTVPWSNLMAIASDYRVDAPLLQFDLNNAEEICDFLEERFGLRRTLRFRHVSA
jgi:molybdopterin-guanine dinucleotide biosynthesis protein B